MTDSVVKKCSAAGPEALQLLHPCVVRALQHKNGSMNNLRRTKNLAGCEVPAYVAEFLGKYSNDFHTFRTIPLGIR